MKNPHVTIYPTLSSMDDRNVAILKQSIKNNSNDKLFERGPLCLYSLNTNSAFKFRMTIILIFSNGRMYTCDKDGEA